MLGDLALVIAADEVSVPFRPQPGTARGKIRFREVKLAVLARLQKVQTQTEQWVTRLQQRLLGDN